MPRRGAHCAQFALSPNDGASVETVGRSHCRFAEESVRGEEAGVHAVELSGRAQAPHTVSGDSANGLLGVKIEGIQINQAVSDA